VLDTVDIAPASAWQPVNFSLLTVGQTQFVAFYDADRQTTVAARKLPERQWTTIKLDPRVGWDTHNYLTLAVDRQGLIHLSGNMHVNPLVYFRTAKPLDITSFQRLPGMAGTQEQRCTYPEFFNGPGGDLVFLYRDGSSGNGNQVVNIYDEAGQKWKRLLDQPLTDGQGKCNAYSVGPAAGPDGFYHLVWTWRDTPDCSTNHDICYARSRDLIHWETSAGQPLALPMTQASAEKVDAVPVRSGVMNNETKVGFDSRNRVIVTYQKYDQNGISQLYNARKEGDAWKIYQTSHWDYRWAFSGGGSIVPEIMLGPVRRGEDGTLFQTYTHIKLGSGAYRLDEVNLSILGPADDPNATPPELGKVESAFRGMQVNFLPDAGKSGEKGVRYVLRWETLPRNRDQARPQPWPDAGMLRVVKLAD
jgi:hypothetical protein